MVFVSYVILVTKRKRTKPRRKNKKIRRTNKEKIINYLRKWNRIMNYSNKIIILKFIITFSASMIAGSVLLWLIRLQLVLGRKVLYSPEAFYSLFGVSLLFALVLSLFYIISERKKNKTKEKRLK